MGGMRTRKTARSVYCAICLQTIPIGTLASLREKQYFTHATKCQHKTGLERQPSASTWEPRTPASVFFNTAEWKSSPTTKTTAPHPATLIAFTVRASHRRRGQVLGSSQPREHRLRRQATHRTMTRRFKATSLAVQGGLGGWKAQGLRRIQGRTKAAQP